MYHAKRIGGDRIEVFKPSMRARKTDRLRRSNRSCAARSSATRSRSSTSRSCGSRTARSPASRRWRAGTTPRWAACSPSEFIAIAEEIGLIVDLGMFVLERTARQLGIWQRSRAPARSGLRQRQRVVAAIAAAGPDPRSAHRDRALGARARHAQARTHRIAGDGESRARRADAAAHPRARRRPRARRFRHRPLLARLPAALPVRHHQDRPVVRARERQGARGR